MAAFINDCTPYYEVYNKSGNVIAKGTSAQVAEKLGLSRRTVNNRIYRGKQGEAFKDGIDIVEVGVLRFVYDMHKGEHYVASGTFEELSALTGVSVPTLKYSSCPIAHERAGSTPSSRLTAMLLYRHDEPRLDIFCGIDEAAINYYY